MSERMAFAERSNDAIVVTLSSVTGDVWKDWRTAETEAARLLKPGEHASRSHEHLTRFYFIAHGRA